MRTIAALQWNRQKGLSSLVSNREKLGTSPFCLCLASHDKKFYTWKSHSWLTAMDHCSILSITLPPSSFSIIWGGERWFLINSWSHTKAWAEEVLQEYAHVHQSKVTCRRAQNCKLHFTLNSIWRNRQKQYLISPLTFIQESCNLLQNQATRMLYTCPCWGLPRNNNLTVLSTLALPPPGIP